MAGEPADPLDDLARGYIPLDEDARDAAWRDGTVVLDANVLLNLYRYSPATRSKLLDVLERIKDRLWIPNQCAAEYFRKRASVLTEQLTARDQLRSRLDGAIADMLAGLREVHRAVGRRDLGEDWASEVEVKLNALRDDLVREEEERVPAANLSDDEVHPALMNLIRGRVGPPYPSERDQEIHAEAANRYRDEIPPGYLDADKNENPYGDVFLWYQTLDHAAETGAAVILVSDDQKDDWVWTERGRKLGPRPELVRELHDRAGVPLLLYTTSTFLEAASEALVSAVDRAVIEEVEDVARSADQWSAMSRDLERLNQQIRSLRLPDDELERLTKQLSTVRLPPDELKRAMEHVRSLNIPRDDLATALDVLHKTRAAERLISSSPGSASKLADADLIIRAGEVGTEAASLQLTSRRSSEIRAVVRISSPDGIRYSKSVRIPPGETVSVEFPEDFGVTSPVDGEYDVRIVTRTRGEKSEVDELDFVLGRPEEE
jgi:PIN like domain